LQRSINIFIAVMRREDNQARLGKFAPNGGNGFNATQDRHAQINECYIWFVLAIEIDGLLSIDSFGDYLHVSYGINQGDKALTDDGLIVDYHDGDLLGHYGCALKFRSQRSSCSEFTVKQM
jgi:hypothetical protein